MHRKNHEIPPELQSPVRVEKFLDLHGFFPEQVAEVVNEFINYAVEQNYSTITIAHGKGKSRLKWEVHQQLKKMSCVLSFRDAESASGGWGRTVVHLKVN